MMDIHLKAPDIIIANALQNFLKQADFNSSFEITQNQPLQIILSTGSYQDCLLLSPPFRFGTILDKIRAFQNTSKSIPDTILIGASVFKPDEELFYPPQHDPIPLTEKETSLLIYLWQARGKTVSRDFLLREIWGYQAKLETHTLETHIYRLRQKIEPNPTDPQLILTDDNGYHLAADFFSA